MHEESGLVQLGPIFEQIIFSLSQFSNNQNRVILIFLICIEILQRKNK